MRNKKIVVIRGAGDLASGVAHRLFLAGFGIIMTEIEHPLAIRRKVSFSEAIYDGKATVEGAKAIRISSAQEAYNVIKDGKIAVIVDPEARITKEFCPVALVDAIMAKMNTGTSISDASVVIALGPGFTAGVDCHAVVETKRGHYLGKVYYKGSALPDDKTPAVVEGMTHQRVLRASADGPFESTFSIGDYVVEGDEVGRCSGTPLVAKASGIIRGLLRNGIVVKAGMKIGDVDPRGVYDYCFTISDKARSIGGGVLEALLSIIGLPRSDTY
ncbi:MAG: selenium-dependent molybdenum cofactor biosynthesis protein YqeB [Acidobacteriota bacterium]